MTKVEIMECEGLTVSYKDHDRLSRAIFAQYWSRQATSQVK